MAANSNLLRIRPNLTFFNINYINKYLNSASALGEFWKKRLNLKWGSIISTLEKQCTTLHFQSDHNGLFFNDLSKIDNESFKSF